MWLKTAIKMMVALENAPAVKESLRKTGGACHRHRRYCTCDTNELCNVALAEFLDIKTSTAWLEWNRLKHDLEKIGAVETRISPAYIEGKLPPYRPRRFIKLTKHVNDVLQELHGDAIHEFNEKIIITWEEGSGAGKGEKRREWG